MDCEHSKLFDALSNKWVHSNGRSEEVVMGSLGLKAKFVGSMVGSALGDGVGEHAFMCPQRDHLCSRLEQLPELCYTDDTAMAIGLAESIIKKRGVDQQHLGKTFNENFEREPWRGYASGPPSVFSLVKHRGITYSEAAQSLFGGEGSFGNGAAMRVAPVGLFFHHSSDLYEQACASAQVTHSHPVGMDGAAIQAFAIAQAVKFDPQYELPSEKMIQGLSGNARTAEIKGKMRLVRELISEDVPPDIASQRIGATVAVHESMPFAVYSFLRHAPSFEECIFCAVLHGGDRDTLGAMAGAISGAYLGIEAIPQSWRRKLENLSYIEELSSKLAEMLTA